MERRYKFFYVWITTKFGIGSSNTGTPLEIRYWLTDGIGIELGGRFEDKKEYNYYEYKEYEISHSFIFKTYSTDNILIEIQPLLNYYIRNTSSKYYENYFELYTKLFFILEFFLKEITPNISLSTGIGVQMKIHNTIDEYSSISLIKSSPFLISVQYYF